MSCLVLTFRLRYDDMGVNGLDAHKMMHNGIFRVGSPFHWAVITDLNASSKPHTHDFYEVFVITDGRILHEANGREELMQACGMALVRPDDRHCYRRAEGTACRFINLAFTPAVAYDAFRYLDHNFQRRLDGLPHPMYSTVEPQQAEELCEALRVVSALPDSAAAARNHRLKLALFGLLAAFIREEADNEEIPRWLAALTGRMQTLERFAVGLPALYELSRYTAEHLSRSFRRYLNTTPTNYINSLRLNYVRNMLETTDLCVAEILAMAGFNSVSHGNHLFRLQYGMPPSEYRRSHSRALVP